ncbi:hypothetical protein PC116_g26632 [Phytophthora cactorum]|uniref:Uncharacterized protein n=1 Tax=Phytophthora cactorum TaxID=29920 RepID=A0A8T0YPU3_9STRA|nr:hypothetical protein Pcac1_g14442 [Phytophthora cactorum]KAG2796071.1 hypothetical protein PC112_g22363 [Phytophthora cactorum]KAG2802240.1 hypothetical protein PC111_g19196 [Phytophthora cactorum]KAG2847049.1 hypothetical protein PC113_g17861 [Phytophthora cactorum]KAG2875015.1 hypothetical protein PC114_g24956 [Phytophthora cactorum]
MSSSRSTKIDTPAYNSPGECKRKVAIFKDVNQKTPFSFDSI